MAAPIWKPELCESCKAGKQRALCPTFPRPCEDLIEIYESGFAAGQDSQRERDAKICDEYAHPTEGVGNPFARILSRQLAERIREGT